MSRKRNFSTPFTWSFQSMEKHGSVMSLRFLTEDNCQNAHTHQPNLIGAGREQPRGTIQHVQATCTATCGTSRYCEDCAAVYLPHSHPWRPSSPPGIHNPQIRKYRATQKPKREARLQQAVWPQFRPPSFQGRAFFRQALAKLLPNFRKKSLYRL